MTHNHLADNELVEMCLTGSSGRLLRHLGTCPDCEVRRDRIARLLDEVTEEAAQAADAAFPADRLAMQQLRILQRIEHEGRPGRLLSFPAAQVHDAALRPTRRPANRWIAAAAVAGLVVGLLAGRLGQQPVLMNVSTVDTSAVAPVDAAFRTSGSAADEEFLGQIELATAGGGGASLRPLDDLTPRAWDVR